MTDEAPNWPKEVRLRDAGVHETEGRRILTTVGMGYEKRPYVLKSHALALVAEALKPWVDLACESHGVTGFHLNGDVAEWDELDMPSTPADAIAAREARDAEIRRKALREAADCIGHITQSEDRDAILALIEKGQTDE